MRKSKTTAAIFAAATVALFAVSCTKEYLDTTKANQIGVKRTITATAALPQGGDKAYLDYADSRKVKWELTDSLNVNGTNIALSSLNADNTTAAFTSTIHAISSGGNDIYWAVYPTSLSRASNGSSIHNDYTASALTVNFPATQTYNSSANALSGNTLMAGYASVSAGTEWVAFQMRNLGSVLKLNLKADASATNKQATKIEFTTTNGALAGDFTVSNNTSNPTVTPAANATQTLTVNLTDGTNNYIDLSTPKEIYVILPPLASKNLTMTIYNTQKKQTNKTMASATLGRNKIYTNTINDLCFCECGGGTPYFSINDSQQVVFAPGNLQYQASTGTWRFAEHQWDFVGTATMGTVNANGVKCDNALISSSYSGWIDLFGWGTSGYDNTANDPWAINYQPWATSTSAHSIGNQSCPNDYGYGPSLNMPDIDLIGTSANYDWGVYNAIYNPRTNTTDPAGTWRTITKAELWYLLNNARSCSGVAFAYATVNGVTGLIITPDNWSNNTYTLNKIKLSGNSYEDNNISGPVWTDVLEPAGCVFFPAAGQRTGTNVTRVGQVGCYWDADHYNGGTVYPNGWGFDRSAHVLQLQPPYTISSGNYINRNEAACVRLVKEID